MQIVAIRDRPATGDWPFRRPTTDPSVLAESTGRVVPVAAAAQGHSAAMRQRRGRVDIHLLSIGHGTLDAAAFNTHLRAADVKSAADVRRFPGSRTNPQFGADALAASLSAAGIEYRTMPELGGRRSATPGSPNTALRNASFRGYADFMQTPEFDLALTDLLMRRNAVVAMSPALDRRRDRAAPRRIGHASRRRDESRSCAHARRAPRRNAASVRQRRTPTRVTAVPAGLYRRSELAGSALPPSDERSAC